MRLGLVLPMFVDDPRRLLGFARRAEDLGYDGVFAFDHLMPLGGPADGAAFECFSTLSAIAASTERMALGTLVARASLRPPGLLAKLAASLHAMAGGRLILTVGTGDDLSKREHDAFGIPYLGPGERRAHLEQVVGAVRDLLAGRAWGGGDRVAAMSGPILPDVRRDRPRVWIGGVSDRAVDTAAALADGWNGWGLPLATFDGHVARLRERLRAARRDDRGRDDTVVETDATWGGVVLVGEDAAELRSLVARRAAAGKTPPPGAWLVDGDGLVANLRALRDAGASWAILLPSGPPDRVDLIFELARPVVAGE
jgi:alkanesulfonate monooxygenase SsuD/methylene tetrahydromethanopterin reductase-like flavin-dependent oxidoreductase (luciferase family)